MPVYKDKKRNTYYYEGSYVDLFGVSQRYKKRGFETAAIAKKEERLFLANVKSLVVKRYKFEELVVMFLEYKKDRVKPRTIFDYEKTIRKQMTPFFEGMYIDKITIPVIEAWQESLLEKDYTNTYLETIQTLMSSLMRFAVRKMIIEKNPFEYIDFVKHPNQAKTIMQFWTYEQYQCFRSMITELEYQTLFDMLYWTGMRIGELQARTWEDFNAFEGTLMIHNNFDNKNMTVTGSTKTGLNRIIYLNKSLLEELKRWKNECSNIDGFNSKSYIFGVYSPISHKTVENRKEKYIKMYNEANPGHPIPRIRIHDFRHSHVSLLINNNVDSFTIAERLGHSKDMVERRYGHMFPEKRKKILNVLDSF